jgi:hypothetical protein
MVKEKKKKTNSKDRCSYILDHLTRGAICDTFRIITDYSNINSCFILTVSQLGSVRTQVWNERVVEMGVFEG